MEPILELEYELDENFKTSTNDIYTGVHWSVRTKIANYFHDIVIWDCKKLQKITDKVNLKFIFTFKKNALDSSNCTFMAKCLEDWFRKGWLLQNDDPKYVWDFICRSQEWNKNLIEIIFTKDDNTI